MTATATSSTTVTATATGCGVGAGSVDQEQLSSDGDFGLSSTQPDGQTFTVGVSGLLTGIEIAVFAQGPTDPSASVMLTLSRAGTVIGTASVPSANLAGAPTSLSDGSVGPGFFDLSSQCIAVGVGDNLALTLTVSGAVGTCDGDTCVGGGNDGSFCMGDFECAFQAGVGVYSGGYAGGTAYLNGSPFGGYAFAFKTFVR